MKTRLVSRLWLKLREIPIFNFYNVGSNSFSVLMNRLARYNYPFGLSIHTPDYTIPSRLFIDHLSQLTRLRSVQIRKLKPDDLKRDYWYALTVLTNISAWMVDGDWPPELLLAFPKLESVVAQNSDQIPQDDRIEELVLPWARFSDTLALETLPSLNSLKIHFIDEVKDLDLNYLTNLTSLELTASQKDSQIIFIDEITSLRRLKVVALNVLGVGSSTNLTELFLDNYMWFYDINMLYHLSSLTNLERLTLCEEVEDDCEAFAKLSRLTYLSAKSIVGDAVQLLNCSVKCLAFIPCRDSPKSLTHLTALEKLEIDGRYGNNSAFLFTSLTHLTSLSFGQYWEKDSQLPRISALTNLVELRLKEAVLASDDYCQLTNVTWLTIGTSDFTSTEYYHLNLKRLEIHCATMDQENWDNLQYLKQLTYLKIEMRYSRSTRDNIVDYSVLSNLPLQTLILNPYRREVNLFETVATLHELRYLQMGREMIASAKQLEMLSHLKHLRHLVVDWLTDNTSFPPRKAGVRDFNTLDLQQNSSDLQTILDRWNEQK